MTGVYLPPSLNPLEATGLLATVMTKCRAILASTTRDMIGAIITGDVNADLYHPTTPRATRMKMAVKVDGVRFYPKQRRRR